MYCHMFLRRWTYAKYFIWTHIIALNIIYSKLFHTSKVCCCHLKLWMLWDYDIQNSTILYHGRAGWFWWWVGKRSNKSFSDAFMIKFTDIAENTKMQVENLLNVTVKAQETFNSIRLDAWCHEIFCRIIIFSFANISVPSLHNGKLH